MLTRRTSYLLLLPAAAIYGGLFVAAAVYFFILSFWSVRGFRVVPGFTLSNYVKTFTTHLGSGEKTLLIAFAIASSAHAAPPSAPAPSPWGRSARATAGST